MREEIIGDCRLILGDCREVLPGLSGVDHIITDPPYGEGTHANHDERHSRRADGANARSLGYESLSVADVLEFAGIFDTVSNGWIVWFTNFDLSISVKDAMAATGRATFPALPYFHAGRSVRLAGDGPSSWTDWILVSRPASLRKWGTLRGGYVAGPGWSDKERMGGKPTALMGLVVADYSREREVVCDPFMGAGTTGVACVASNRAFIGCEVDAKSFDVACRRIEAAHRQPRLFAEPIAKPVQETLAL